MTGPSGCAPRAGLRERAGVALVDTATRLAAERRTVVRRIAAMPDGTPGRNRALGNLAFAAWVESVLLWLGWRLLPGHAVVDRAGRPAP